MTFTMLKGLQPIIWSKVQYWNTQWGYCADLFAQRFYASVLCAALVLDFYFALMRFHTWNILCSLCGSAWHCYLISTSHSHFWSNTLLSSVSGPWELFLLTARAVTWTLLIKVLGKHSCFTNSRLLDCTQNLRIGFVGLRNDNKQCGTASGDGELVLIKLEVIFYISV